MSELIDSSFDNMEQLEFPLSAEDDGSQSGEGQTAESFPIKKLSDVFDNCAKSMSEGNMKVYLRVRPSSSSKQSVGAGGVESGSTINIESDTSIVTNAPESSKRAQYTKMEERHYVCFRPPFVEHQLTDLIALTLPHVAPPKNRLLRAYLDPTRSKTTCSTTLPFPCLSASCRVTVASCLPME